MGLNDKQFRELVILLLFVIIYPLFPLYLAKTYNTMIGFVVLIIPNTLILVYLYFKIDNKKVENEEADTVYDEVMSHA